MSWHANRFIPDGRKVQVSCANCGCDMWLPKSKAKSYKSCSAECSASLRAAARQARQRNCETCGARFTPRKYQLESGGGRFCSQQCNEASRAALNSDQAKQKAKAVQAAMRARGEMRMASGPRNPRWNGGVSQANGYINLRDGARYVPEHRIVMERHIGRPLHSDEVVHHINHDKTDNRIENLQIMSRAEHINEHRADLLEGLRRFHEED